MNKPSPSFGMTRERGPTVSYPEIERAARAVMAEGNRPTSKNVLEKLGRGSPNHIGECMRRFWKDQAAVNAGDPLALSRLPPELAEAAVAQWEQALRLSQQSADYENNQARAVLEQLRRETDAKSRSVELREKEWDIAARVRERALTDSREQVNALVKELAADRSLLRARDTRIADLESQLEEYRRQLAVVVTRAIARNRSAGAGRKAAKKPNIRILSGARRSNPKKTKPKLQVKPRTKRRKRMTK